MSIISASEDSGETGKEETGIPPLFQMLIILVILGLSIFLMLKYTDYGKQMLSKVRVLIRLP